MTALRLLAATTRTLSVLIAPPGARFALPEDVEWSLVQGDQVIRSGRSKVAALFLDGLEPETRYRLETALGSLEMSTLPCAGLVDATHFGVDPAAEDNADAFHRAIHATPDGGTLRLVAGHYRSRPIFLKPRMTLLLEGGAILAAISERANWPKLPARDEDARTLGTWEGLPEPCYAALITGVDVHDVAITGSGAIDGGGDRGDWWDWPKETREGARRPRAVHLAYSDRVTMNGVTVCNSPSWTVHPYRCRDLTVATLTIKNPPDSPNTDGLNPESCEGVRITGVDFSVGDDCIAIKAGKRQHDAPDARDDHLAPTRDVRIAHCRMQRGHGAVVMGSEMSGGIHDVTVENCEFDQTDRGLRIKTRRGRGGVVDRISITNVEMDRVATPLAINAFYFCDADGKDDWVQSRAAAPVDESTPTIRGITLSEVRASRVGPAAAAILGLPEAPVTDVRLENFTVSFDEDAIPEIPLMALNVPSIKNVPLFAEFADVTGTAELLEC